MTQRFFRTLSIVAALAVTSLSMSAIMTDNEVVSYIKTATSQGKSQQQIGRELLARGVTEDQLRRIKTDYEKNNTVKIEQTADNKVSRVHEQGKTTGMNAEITDMSSATDALDVSSSEMKKSNVFGSNLFKSRNLTFEPNENMATPQEYRLGPGDEVVINIWGNNEDIVRQTISPEGRIFVSQIGPIYLNGLSVAEANNRVKDIFASKYADVAGEGSDISLTLGQLRTIQVDIMGEVNTPGTYRISPFSTLFHALYNAGGPTSAGSLRTIDIMRNGRKVATADVYDYLFNGKQSTDIKLQEGDVIIVPAYDRHVSIGGEVKRPMMYELKKGETVSDLIAYAGGLTAAAYGDKVNIDRTINGNKSVAVIESTDFDTSRLDDGDMVTVGKALNRYDNRVDIEGAVMRPGIFAIDGSLSTVKDLIKAANGLREDAFLNRAQIIRETADLTPEVMSIDLGGILRGTSPDIKLHKNDLLIIASSKELNPTDDVIIAGEVHRPGKYAYGKNMTLEDLIMLAGGLNEGASTVKVDVSRRIANANSTTVGEFISHNFSFTIDDGFVVDGDPDFILKPNDIVDIRLSPGYVTQRRVMIDGEVNFAGSYTLEKRTERISDLVRRAGGLTKYAYINGAHLSRQRSDDEMIAQQEIIRLASTASDSISVEKLQVSSSYLVGIDLQKALAHPGSDADLVLKAGDKLMVPEMVNTVTISGDVLYPNTVVYTPGMKYKDYVKQAGGFGNSANKGKAFVVYLNGTVARAKDAQILPGSQIIVPSKSDKPGMSLAQWLAIGTSAASLGTMAASIYNIIK